MMPSTRTALGRIRHLSLGFQRPRAGRPPLPGYALSRYRDPVMVTCSRALLMVRVSPLILFVHEYLVFGAVSGAVKG